MTVTKREIGSRRQPETHRSGERQERLLHGYLHKTSNSLCGIKGYASLIAAEYGGEGKMGRWARKIVSEVDQMERMYRSVQEMAFPKPEQNSGSGNLAALIENVAMAANASHPNLEIRLAVPVTGALRLPAKDLEQVLVEVLANAAESDSANGVQARIRTTRRRGSIWIEINDDGCGMTADLQREAALPFVSTKSGHLGTGLARVDTIMDMYGLDWSLESRPGNGTCVSLETAWAPESASRTGRPERKEHHV